MPELCLGTVLGNKGSEEKDNYDNSVVEAGSRVNRTPGRRT